GGGGWGVLGEQRAAGVGIGGFGGDAACGPARQGRRPGHHAPRAGAVGRPAPPRRMHRLRHACDTVTFRAWSRQLEFMYPRTFSTRSSTCTLPSVSSTRLASTCSPAGSSDRKSTRLNSSHVKISYAVF